MEPTPVVLLLLVIIAKFTLTLGGHAALGLQHLLCFVWSWLVSLVCVKILEIRTRMGADLIELADRMMSLGHSTHTRVYNICLEQLSPLRTILHAPKSEKARGPPIIGIDSRLEGGLKSFPLLLRLSRARLTSSRRSIKVLGELHSR